MPSVSTAPPGTRGPKRGQNPHAMTPERIALFLKSYRESGANFTEAARVACPHPKEGVVKPCYSSFKKLLRRDMGFQAACEEIKAQVCDDIEAEIDRRGRRGWLDPIVQKGEHVTDADGKPMFIRRYDSKLLLARARALMPNKYGEKKTVDLIHHKASGGMMVIEAADVQHFTQKQIEALGDLMSTIREHREGAGEAPELIEHQPAPVLEIPVTEVEPVAVESVSKEETAEKAFPY